MENMPVPKQKKQYSTKYTNLKGVDFSCDNTEVNQRRSPSGINMISDDGGNPVKRLGWRVIANLNCGEIFEIIFHEDEETLYDHLKAYVIGETGIYAVVNDDEGQHIITMLSKNITSARYFLFNGEVYAFVNSGMYKLFGVTASPIENVAYVPEAVISRNPDGTGGVTLENINLLTPRRMFSFLGNDTDTVYYLYPADVRGENKYKYIVKPSIKVEIRTSNGWEVTSDYTLPPSETIQGLNVEGESESFEVCEPKITFSSTHAPLVTGQDNIRVTFENFDNEDMDLTNKKGQYKVERVDILSTTACMTYGYSAVDRVFLVGGINRNRVYYSDVNEPMYYPDDNYLTVGHDNNGIAGLHRISSYLAAIKEDSPTEGTVFLISGAYLNNEMYFQVTPTSASVGAIAPKSFATLIDEPLFLTRDGIYAVANYYTTTEKVLRNRSYFVDKKLVKEIDLNSACATVWRRYYILCVNDNCYVLDGRNKANDRNNNTDFLYEAYYWENIPARVFCVYENELYFGDADGHLCKFNTDVPNRTAYCDNGNLIEDTITDGVPIKCEWSTPLDDDGSPQYFKTLNKKGTLLTMQPHDMSSAKVTLVRDGGERVYVGEFFADIQNWELIDFTRFTFNADNTAQDAFFRKKMNKYKRLQIVVENDAIYEPFGILGIVKTYTIGNFSKNRG